MWRCRGQRGKSSLDLLTGTVPSGTGHPRAKDSTRVQVCLLGSLAKGQYGSMVSLPGLI